MIVPSSATTQLAFRPCSMPRADLAHPGLVTRKCRKLGQFRLLQHKMPGGIPDSSVAEIVRWAVFDRDPRRRLRRIYILRFLPGLGPARAGPFFCLAAAEAFTGSACRPAQRRGAQRRMIFFKISVRVRNSSLVNGANVSPEISAMVSIAASAVRLPLSVSSICRRRGSRGSLELLISPRDLRRLMTPVIVAES
ncbi:hypothetical protein ACVINW_000191 [Bradyrhizobium sp. USDA 4461]